MTPTDARASANGIEIAYQAFGDAADPPMVMVMGLGAQMIAWPDELCQDLAECGHYVIRFDNRDVGESTHLQDAPTPDPLTLLLGRKSIPYRIEDMADDTIGLIEALGFDEVDLVGVSLGGFISQTVAIRAPQRVRTLALMMTSTGSPLVGHPKPRLIANVFRRSPKPDRDQAIDSAVEALRAISSPAYPFESDYIRDIALRSYDRSYDPAGYMRQFAAVRFQSNRTRALSDLTMPTLVMHGLADPLISVSGGVAVARAVPRARFLGFHGMGHDLPRALWQDYANAIDTLTRSRVALATG